ncbi:uncharacterized protein LOC115233621 isoform X2 [Formica exsecta]|uniref:uncharacterized protein LOC115233621 isoform X2 n=1 Tax=Formica exsecta TaxID=72781 RepID=UPI001142E292|nr:uncharacterized protein LOC115233621 isoform X2 [Formica exsecta]
MTTATVRQLRDVLEPSRRTRAASHNMDVRTVQNWLNRLPDGWNSPQSPDELVIQKRGRRKSIVWSPDLNTYKRRNLLSLSAKDHTPIKSSTKSNMALREAAKKRLSLGDPHQSEFSTPKGKKALLSSRMSLDAANTPRQRSDDNLVNGLRDLSHEQLIRLIMELVYAQEDGTLRKNEKLRYILSKKISDADIQPFIEKLIVLRQTIYASLVFSPNLNDESAYNCAYIHLDAFQKALIDQGRILQESQHWVSLMHYVLESWKITRELPKWENQDPCNITSKCFKSLSQFCAETIRRGKFETSTLETYIESLKTIVEECEEFQICLQMAKEAKHEA